jgi:hypothetical protein
MPNEIHYSLFSASVHLPSLYLGESQLPPGDSLPPPSQSVCIGFKGNLAATETPEGE